jgi:hypothetical protein
MSCQINWVAFFRVNSRERVERLLDRFAQALGQEIAVGECEKYWKDPSCFRVAISSELPDGPLGEAIWATLQSCWRLARNWTVGPPQTYEQGRWEFFGSAADKTTTVKGLVHLDFRAGNLEEAGQAFSRVVVPNREGITTA